MRTKLIVFESFLNKIFGLWLCWKVVAIANVLKDFLFKFVLHDTAPFHGVVTKKPAIKPVPFRRCFFINEHSSWHSSVLISAQTSSGSIRS